MVKKENLVERIYLDKEEFIKTEKNVLFHEHLRRYGSIRRFCYGKVLDFAAGCGYGSYLLAGNPDVSKVTAIDIDEHAIEWAKKEFKHDKIEYKLLDIDEVKDSFDTLVCLETIEHLKDASIVSNLVERCNINNIIISFPDKKTTHYNQYHFHDFIKQDIIDMFNKHIVYHTIRFVDSQSILLIRLPENAPWEIFRNIKDL